MRVCMCECVCVLARARARVCVCVCVHPCTIGVKLNMTYDIQHISDITHIQGIIVAVQCIRNCSSRITTVPSDTQYEMKVNTISMYTHTYSHTCTHTNHR